MFQMLIVPNDKQTKRASVVVLTETGSVSSMSILPIEAAGEASLDVILTSPRGDFVQLLVSEIELEAQGPLKAQPLIRKKEFKSTTSFRIVEFEKFKECTKYTLLGDYFCWNDEKKVMCQHFEGVKPVKEIDLTYYFAGDNAGEIAIDGCMQKSLIEAGYLTAVNQHNLHKLENYLQVTIDNRILIFDINVQKPTLVKELEESEKMMDP